MQLNPKLINEIQERISILKENAKECFWIQLQDLEKFDNVRHDGNDIYRFKDICRIFGDVSDVRKLANDLAEIEYLEEILQKHHINRFL